MQLNSRTANSFRNARIALFFYCANLIFQFFSRKIFLDHLGTEVLGLNITAQNLLGFLNLAELGIGAAVSYSLYKPLLTNDKRTVNDIVSIQGWLYRKIACIVIAGACIVMCFFPWIFSKAEVPLCYAYCSFIVLLISVLLGYFVNYRQIVLSADQKEYKITYCVQGSKLAKVFLQVVILEILNQGYVCWIGLELLFAIVTSIFLDRVIKKEYSWLCPQISRGKELKSFYPSVFTKTKQIFFHKIAGVILTQTSPLIIYAYVSLTMVAIYGNYMLIVNGVMALMNALLNGIGAGIGNLIAEGNRIKIKSVYWKITTLRIWLASIVCFGMYMLGDSFITLWIGDAYLMPNLTYNVLIAITFIQLTRTNEVFLAAYGLYQDIGAPLLEAMLNLGLSVILGYYWGLTGILLGVFISLLIIVVGWKSWFLYKQGFEDSILEFIIRVAKYLSLFAVSFGVSKMIVENIKLQNDTYLHWILYTVESIVVYIVISFTLLWSLDSISRSYIKWIYMLIFRKGKI